MDPTCGRCLSGDCGGSPAYTDPKCPEHGIVAKASRQQQLDSDIAGLTRQSLRRLTREAPPRERFIIPNFGIPQTEAAPHTIIREKSKWMLAAASNGRRRVKLFEVSPPNEVEEPQRALTETQREVCRHFEERGLRIVFREDWNTLSERKYDVFATW